MSKAKSQWVALLPKSTMPFRRAIRDEKGNVTKVLRFEPEQPIEVQESEHEIICQDIGRTLCFVTPRKDQPGRFDVDWDATNDCHVKHHDTVIPRHAARSVSVGLAKPKTIVDSDQQSDSEEESEEEEVEITALLDAGIEMETAERLVDNLDHAEGGDWVLEPEAIRQKVADGFDLTKLKGIGEATAKKITTALEGK